MAAMDQLVGLTNVLQAFQGQESETKTRTKSSKTTQTNISDQGVNKLIQDILSGPGGVRSVGGAARSAGLYNSTTEDMLLGDLYSRAAVSAELARSPTVVTTDQLQTQAMETPGIGGQGLGAIGGMMLANQAGKALFGAEATAGAASSPGMLSGIGDAISGMFGGGAAAATPAVTNAATSAVTGATIGAAANTIGSEVVKMGATGTAAGTGAAAAGGAAGAAGIGFNAATAIPLGGSFLSGLLGGREASQEPGSLAMSAMAGAMALGPIGLIAAPLAAIAGGFLSDLSVVCTALMKRGLISKNLHRAGERHFATVDGVTKLGYWMWAEAVAKKIDSGSTFWTYFTYPVTKGYLEFLRSDRNWGDVVFHPIGALTYFAGESFCRWLGQANLYYQLRLKQY